MTTTDESGSEASLGETEAGTETDSDEDAAEEPRFRHDAFLCYSHANSEAALAVQHGLRRLATSRFRRSSLSVFRDDTNLASTPSLWPSIAEAIEASQHLIVLASPDAAKSKWVNREIVHFLNRQPRRPVHVVLLDGTLVWDDAKGGFDEESSDALPPSLRHAFDEEPLILDVRELHDTEDRWTLNDGIFRRIIARLAAPIRELSPEDLDDADRRGQRRALRQAQTAVSLLVVLLLVAVATGVVARNAQRDAERNATQAEENAAQAEESAARALAQQARALIPDQPELAVAIAAEAVERLETPETTNAFQAAHLAYSQMPAHLQHTLTGHKGAVNDVAFSPDGSLLATASDDGVVKLWNPQTGEEVSSLAGDASAFTEITFNPNSSLLAAVGHSIKSGDINMRGETTGITTIWDFTTGDEVDILSEYSYEYPVNMMPNTIAFSPDGILLAVVAQDAATVWNAKTKGLTALTGHTESVVEVAFSPDSALIATASWDGSVRLWNPISGEELVKFDIDPDIPTDIAFTSDGDKIVATSDNLSMLEANVRLLDLKTGANHAVPSEHEANLHGPLNGLTISTDGRRIATTSWGNVSLLDSETSEKIASITIDNPEQFTTVAFSPDSSFLATASTEGTTRLWNSQTGENITTLAGHTGSIATLVFSPGNDRIAIGSSDGTASVWSLKSAQAKTVLNYKNDFVVARMSFSPDNSRLVTIGARSLTSSDPSPVSSNASLWNPLTGDKIAVLSGHVGMVNHIEFSPDGRLFATTSEEDDVVRLWDTKTGMSFDQLTGHTAPVSDITFSSDGLLATADEGGIAKVWRPEEAENIVSLTEHAGSITAVDFSSDGKLLATTSDDGTTKIWDPIEGSILNTITNYSSALGQMHFSFARFRPDSTLIAISDLYTLETSTEMEVYNVVELWDSLTGRKLMTFPRYTSASFPPGIIFSPDGTLLAIAYQDDQVMLWDLNTSREIAKLTEHAGSVTAVNFSSDGKMLATTSDDGTTKIWDPRTGEEITTVTSHSLSLYPHPGAAFSSDSKLLATTSGKDAAKLWGPTTGDEIATFTDHTDSITDILFSPDDTMLATASGDGTVVVRQLVLTLAEACEMVGSQVTREELVTALGGDEPRACTNVE